MDGVQHFICVLWPLGCKPAIVLARCWCYALCENSAVECMLFDDIWMVREIISVSLLNWGACANSHTVCCFSSDSVFVPSVHSTGDSTVREPMSTPSHLRHALWRIQTVVDDHLEEEAYWSCYMSSEHVSSKHWVEQGLTSHSTCSSEFRQSRHITSDMMKLTQTICGFRSLHRAVSVTSLVQLFNIKHDKH